MFETKDHALSFFDRLLRKKSKTFEEPNTKFLQVDKMSEISDIKKVDPVILIPKDSLCVTELGSYEPDGRWFMEKFESSFVKGLVFPSLEAAQQVVPLLCDKSEGETTYYVFKLSEVATMTHKFSVEFNIEKVNGN